MRNSLTILLLCVVFGLNAQGNWNWGNREKVRGNGDVTSEMREVRAFDGLKVCCSLKVEVSQGSDHSVKVKAESNLQPYIKTEVSGGRLEVGFTGKVNVKSTEPIIVYITMPTLDYVSASSSAKVIGQSSFTGADLELDVSSSGFINLDFTGDIVRADASSGGKVELDGRAKRIRAAASSGGKVRAGELVAARGRANASSGGGVTVNVTEELDANASSGGGVRYYGSPANVDANRSSGGTVRKQE